MPSSASDALPGRVVMDMTAVHRRVPRLLWVDVGRGVGVGVGRAGPRAETRARRVVRQRAGQWLALPGLPRCAAWLLRAR